MKAVLLDAASLGDDVDLTPIRALVENLDVHQLTSPEQTRKRLTGATIALTNKVVIDAELIDALPELKLICVLATGTNNIDMAAAERRGIVVRNVSELSSRVGGFIYASLVMSPCFFYRC